MFETDSNWFYKIFLKVNSAIFLRQKLLNLAFRVLLFDLWGILEP